MSFIDKLKHQTDELGPDEKADHLAEPATASQAEPAGGFDPLIDEEEVAEEVLSTDLDPEAPLDAPPEAAGGLAGARPQRAYDASGEPIDDLPLESDAPDVPGASGSGSW